LLEINVSDGQSEQFAGSKPGNGGKCEDRLVRLSCEFDDLPHLRHFEEHGFGSIAVTCDGQRTLWRFRNTNIALLSVGQHGLIAQLFAVAGGRLKILEHHLAGLRALANDEEILALFTEKMSEQKRLQVEHGWKKINASAVLWKTRKLLEERARSLKAKRVES